MAVRTLEHFFNTYAEAVQAVADLNSAGVLPADITLIDSEQDPRLPAEVTDDPAENPIGKGATLGTAVGGGIGALIGVGAVAVPYTDPLVQAGWIVCTVTGAGIGAAIGALIGSAMRLRGGKGRAHAIAEGLSRGKHLVVVRVDDAYAAQIDAILRRPRIAPAAVDPEFDMVPVDDTRTPEQITADIHRRERTIDYQGD